MLGWMVRDLVATVIVMAVLWVLAAVVVRVRRPRLAAPVAKPERLHKEGFVEGFLTNVVLDKITTERSQHVVIT